MYPLSKGYQASLSSALGDEDVLVFAYETLDSTNAEAKRIAANGQAASAIVAADGQTAGRGRMGRSFYSPNQTGAYFSFLYTPSQPLDNAVSVTSAAAVAVRNAIFELTGLECDIKWVNDLYLNGKKICGILCESVFVNEHPQIIVGIGINLSTTEFPKPLSNKAGALGASVDRCKLIAAVWRNLKPFLQNANDHSWLEAYRAHSCVIGRQVEWTEGDHRFGGVVTGIDFDGGLVVSLADGTQKTLRTGEISVFVDGINL